ncbi:hypothetical protein GCM10022252_76080 [Streptosporangium oxazolinicum]|uniref:HTH cro/C1-type domain-containing protein n=1 Tax=Streptosporangium oxazolinicum TaxID=909287 RepID=A0ABP8BLD5_9ACTN
MATDHEKYRAALRDQQRARHPGVPVPYRITAALDSRDMDGPEVDRALGGEEPMVDDWEAGKTVPTPEQIEALARLTAYPVEFFYLPAPPPMIANLCRRSGPRKDRCQKVNLGGPPAPAAPVIPMTGRSHVWACRVPTCPTRGKPHPAATAQAAAAGWRRHYLTEHYQAPTPNLTTPRQPPTELS